MPEICFRTAYHEAGHAVAGFALGASIEAVSARPISRVCTLRGFECLGRDGGAVVAYAGDLAEELFVPHRGRVTCDLPPAVIAEIIRREAAIPCDGQRIVDAAADIAPADRMAWAVARCIEAAELLMRNSEAVVGLARLLARRGTVDGETAEAILRSFGVEQARPVHAAVGSA